MNHRSNLDYVLVTWLDGDGATSTRGQFIGPTSQAPRVDEGRAADYGAATISPLLSGNFAGAVVEWP